LITVKPVIVLKIPNSDPMIEVKARIEHAGCGKPVIAPICVFWAKLIGTEHCSEDPATVPGAWNGAIEMDASGRLASFT
jgi:hypothetical protein